MRTTITADLVRKLTGGPACDVWDTKFPGLVLRVRASGRASYAFVYGRGKKETLGRADALTPAQARGLAQQVIGDVAHGKDPQAERRKRRAGTLRQFLDEQYAPWATADHTTGASAVQRVERFGDALLDQPITKITTWQLEQWRTRRRTAGIENSTINREIADLRSVLSKAVEWKIIDEHPLRDLKNADTDTLGRVRYLSAQEDRRLRDALVARDEARRDGRRRFNVWRAERGYRLLPDYGAYPDHLAPITLLALNTGLRRGELFALRWSDVDLVAARLTVRGRTAKSGRTRHVPLNTEIVAVLRAWVTCRPMDLAAFVFPGPQGERMTTLRTSWKKVAGASTPRTPWAAHLEDFTFHDLRHTFASKLVMAGVDLNTVRELLGHADIKMTLRYAHLAPEHKAAAVEKLVNRSA